MKILKNAARHIPSEGLWTNADSGLKTRGAGHKPARQLAHMVGPAPNMRGESAYCVRNRGCLQRPLLLRVWCNAVLSEPCRHACPGHLRLSQHGWLRHKRHKRLSVASTASQRLPLRHYRHVVPDASYHRSVTGCSHPYHVIILSWVPHALTATSIALRPLLEDFLAV